MRPRSSLDHEQLLTLAHKTQADAHDHDRDRLEAHAQHLFEALTEHVLAERSSLLRIPPGDARLLERGQQRLVDLLVELTAAAAHGDETCRCDHIADTMLAELTLQANEERHYLAPAG